MFIVNYTKTFLSMNCEMGVKGTIASYTKPLLSEMLYHKARLSDLCVSYWFCSHIFNGDMFLFKIQVVEKLDPTKFNRHQFLIDMLPCHP
jgi:hypothetical protein